jgi:ubiquitin carboxyl-terminal hydrolase 8
MTELGISKFKNDNGISCYINSILHILQQLPYFADYIISDTFQNDITDKIDVKQLVVYELYRILKLSYENNNINITPTSFKKIIAKKNSMWGELEQQDSQEFLIFMISKLEEELGSKIEFIPGRKNFLNEEKELIKISDIYNICGLERNKNDFSIIRELFIGSSTSNVVCEYCKSHTPSFENFITLSLDIPLENGKEHYTLNECIKHTFKDEQFDSDNKVNCDFCGIKNKSTKQIKLWKTPKILIIHFKRFKMNEYGQQVAKITNQISYPISNLNISEYFDKHSPFKESIYNLIGINIHEELMHKSTEVGHYISAVKNRYNNKWYIFNDSAEPYYLKNTQLQHKNAYMLFYILNKI